MHNLSKANGFPNVRKREGRYKDMLREEFNELISKKLFDGKPFDIGDEEYKVIETVYCFHPSISDTDGKKQVADLYANFGFVIFLDMLPRAKVIENIYYERMKIEQSLKELEEEEDFARCGDLDRVNEVLRDF